MASSITVPCTVYAALAATHEELAAFANLASSSASSTADQNEKATLLELYDAAAATVDALSTVEILSAIPSRERTSFGADILCQSPSGCTLSIAFAAAAVNRHWRSVALTTPSIWSKAEINFLFLDGATDYIDCILARCKACPLDLDLVNAPTAESHPTLPSATLVPLLASCRRLEVQIRYTTQQNFNFDRSILSIFQAEFPVLESIVLQSSAGLTLRIPTGALLFTSAPKLRHLALDTLPLAAIDLSTLHGVSSFATNVVLTAEHCRDISANLPLTALSIGAVLDTSPSTLVAFPHLESLCCTRATGISCIGSRANVPRLHTLDILCHRDILPPLEALFSPGWKTLRELTIRSEKHRVMRTTPPATLVPLLASCASLRFLRMANFTDGDMIQFCAAWQEGDNIGFLPNLETLEYTQCSFGVSATNALVRFLGLRSVHPAGRIPRLVVLQKSALRSGTELFPQWMTPRLRQLVGEVVVDIATAIRTFVL
ncbi:hypothetical protein EXIGLDRAFT_727858 [Exidia glandulosa HHB12029]|uniref:F-box domain-containing protein n=1 Tax=Exidia glandulosa HHB12029 TaxID=1314781 RepID=A0A165LX77_EXIGL|nr:hypothetical protein EXIGLDRAFT_727858 [Exidia glandulosa HHB12029]